MAMLQQVQRYYKMQGISPMHFSCRRKGECEADCSDFTGPKEPHIGTKYEIGRFPRILFLSLDSGRESREPSRRTAPAVRRWAENVDVEAIPKRRHWRVTHEMAGELLKAYKPGLKLNEIAPFFAHSNAAKCCQNKLGKQQADKKLFRKCSEYIVGELKILRPDVLVTQGREAFNTIELALRKREISSLRPVTWESAKTGGYGELVIGGRKVLWFPSLHPQARGNAFQLQRERCWKRWSRKV